MEQNENFPDVSASFSELSNRLIRSTSRDFSRIAFLKHISPLVSEIAGVTAFELWIQDNDLYYRWYYRADREPQIIYNRLTSISDSLFCNLDNCKEPTPLERLYHQVFSGDIVFPHGFSLERECFHTGSLTRFFEKNGIAFGDKDGFFNGSLMLARFSIDPPNKGLISFMEAGQNAFPPIMRNHLRDTAELLGVALAGRRSHFALRERVKELTCLYEIAQIGANPKLSIEQILEKTADILPSAWQYPDLAEVKILFGGKTYTSSRYADSPVSIRQDLEISGQPSDYLEVVYRDFKSELGEEAFLPEEYTFISTTARQLSILLERRLSLLEKAKLQEQLRHADRLATIGQLASGVAHEINDPLAAILGFAQLIEEQVGLNDQSRQDINRIVNASLHAREIVKKLLIFARRLPQKNRFIQVNTVIENDLYFLEFRCQKDGISLVRKLGDVPEIWADESQMHQIIINLTVNAIQAMPDGGTLSITTWPDKQRKEVCLSVKDTGIGMDSEVKKNLFLPFFTTKKAGEGTGIGLSVVHGIIEGMKGAIRIDSAPGKGSTFTISLPINPAERQQP